MKSAINVRTLIGSLIVLIHSQVGFSQQKPVIEYSSLLSSLTVSPDEHVLDFRSDLIGVFLPPTAEVTAVLTKAGDPTQLHRQTFRSRQLDMPFTRLIAAGAKNYKFEQEGDYQVTFYADRVSMTQVKFSLDMRKDTPPAESDVRSLASGPWEQWAYVWFPKGKREEGHPEVRLWRSHLASQSDSEATEYQIEIKKDGEIVAKSRPVSVKSPEYTQVQFPLLKAGSQEETLFLAKDFLTQGTYYVLVKRNGQLDGIYPMEVADEQPVFPRQQVAGYQPPQEYIYPRIPGTGTADKGAGDTLWMERLSAGEAVNIINQKQPVVEFSSILSNLDVSPTTHDLEWKSHTPLVAAYVSRQAEVEAILTKANGFTPLHTLSFQVAPMSSPFSTLSAVKTNRFTFSEAGDYQLTFHVNGKPATRVAFSIEILKSDDAFNPKHAAFTKGPWANQAVLWSPVDNEGEGQLQVHLWRNQPTMSENPNPVNYTVELLHNGDSIAQANSALLRNRQQSRLPFALKHAFGPTGTPFRKKDALAHEGTYYVLVKKDGQLDAIYSYEIQGGKFLFPEQQAADYEPRSDYRIPRYPGTGTANTFESHDPADEDATIPRYPGTGTASTGAGDLLWMTRLKDTEANEIANLLRTEVARSSEEQLKHWQLAPVDESDRKFKLVVTSIELPSAAALSAGKDVIAFHSGSQGVQYLKAGEDKPLAIPESETYASEVFAVAGQKILLVKENQLIVYDTTTNKTTAIPKDEINLLADAKGLPTTGSFKVDGPLVATINNPAEVKDQNILKVIDLSKDEPEVIPIQNSLYSASNITSLAIDAQSGLVAVSCQAKNAVFVSGIVPGARQKPFSLANDNGLGDRSIQVFDNQIFYNDSQSRLRALDITTGTSKLMELQSPAKEFVAKETFVVGFASKQQESRMQYWIGTDNETPKGASNQGQVIEEEEITLGEGQSAVIAEDGTVFLAGADPFEKGDVLQAGQDKKWTVLTNSQKKPMPAIDLKRGQSLIAFKSLDAKQKIVLAYATYGKEITFSAPDSSPSSAATTTATVSPIQAAPSPPRPAPVIPPPPPVNQNAGSSSWTLYLAVLAVVSCAGYFIYRRRNQST